MKRAHFLATLASGVVLAGLASGALALPVARMAAVIETAAAQQVQATAFDSSAPASAAEDMIDFALAGDAGRVEEKLSELSPQIPAIRKALGDAAATGVEKRLAEIEAALGQGDFTGVALQANEAFRTIVEARGVTGTVPIEVSLLDYSGFKLKTLANAGSVDWAAMAAATDEASGFWKPLADKVKEKGLRDLMNSLQDGLSQGVAEQDATQVAFAAQMLLDAVDLLEKSFG